MQRILSQIGIKFKAVKWAAWKRIRKTITIPTHQGRLTVDTRDAVIGKQLYQVGQFQHETSVQTTAFLRQQRLIPPRGKGVILDVGANIGVISIGMLVNGEFAAGIGIEPEPSNFALCQRNVAQNALSDRYTALQFAVSDQAGTIQFELSPDNLGDHRVRVNSNALEELSRKVITVEARPLDGILDQLPKQLTDDISLVWIDVQGHEGHVFAGGKRLFSRNVPVVAEIWPFGINRSGMSTEQMCEIASGIWSHFLVWRRCRRYVKYPIRDLITFCEELGDTGESDDVILTKN